MDSLIVALETAKRLLETYNYYGQANYLNKIIAAVSQAGLSADAVQLLQSKEIWGGAGAVWDCVLTGLPSAQRDEKEFRKCMITIADQMRHHGMQSARAERIAEIFRSWTEKKL